MFLGMLQNRFIGILKLTGFAEPLIVNFFRTKKDRLICIFYSIIVIKDFYNKLLLWMWTQYLKMVMHAKFSFFISIFFYNFQTSQWFLYSRKFPDNQFFLKIILAERLDKWFWIIKWNLSILNSNRNLRGWKMRFHLHFFII